MSELYKKCFLLQANGKYTEEYLDTTYLPDTTNELIGPYLNNIVDYKNLAYLQKHLNFDMLQWSSSYYSPDIILIFSCYTTWDPVVFQQFHYGKPINKQATYICKKHSIFGPCLIYSSKPGKSEQLKIEKIIEKSKIKISENQLDVECSINDGFFKAKKQVDAMETMKHFYDELLKFWLVSLEDIYLILGPNTVENYIEKKEKYYNAFCSYNIAPEGSPVHISIEPYAEDGENDEKNIGIYKLPKTKYRYDKDNVEKMIKIKKEKGYFKKKFF